jgi:hypothetical protein
MKPHDGVESQAAGSRLGTDWGQAVKPRPRRER